MCTTNKEVFGQLCGFNTASGMDCMQFLGSSKDGQDVFVFQYRKRYGLHAMNLRKQALLLT